MVEVMLKDAKVVIEKVEESYKVSYFEYYTNCGYRFLESEICNKECVEIEWGVTLD